MNFANTVADFVRKKLFDPVFTNRDGLTMGRVFWVMNAADAGYVDFVAEHPNYSDGVAAVYTTVEDGYAAMVTNRGDVLRLASHGSHAITEMLTVSKNRCHFVGMDMGGRQTGQGSRLVMGVTTAATDLACVKVSGVRNSFRNIKIESSNTKAESLYALIDAGEFTMYENVTVLKLTDLDQTTAADVVMEGDSTTWRNCEFGAATVLTTVARPTVLVDKIVGTTGMLDNNFINCNFVAYTSSADKVFIKVAATGDGQRYAMFRGCAFINWAIAAGGTTMTNAISAGSGSELLIILDANCISVGCTNIASSTTTILKSLSLAS